MTSPGIATTVSFQPASFAAGGLCPPRRNGVTGGGGYGPVSGVIGPGLYAAARYPAVDRVPVGMGSRIADASGLRWRLACTDRGRSDPDLDPKPYA